MPPAGSARPRGRPPAGASAAAASTAKPAGLHAFFAKTASSATSVVAPQPEVSAVAENPKAIDCAEGYDCAVERGQEFDTSPPSSHYDRPQNLFPLFSKATSVVTPLSQDGEQQPDVKDDADSEAGEDSTNEALPAVMPLAQGPELPLLRILDPAANAQVDHSIVAQYSDDASVDAESPASHPESATMTASDGSCQGVIVDLSFDSPNKLAPQARLSTSESCAPIELDLEGSSPPLTFAVQGDEPTATREPDSEPQSTASQKPSVTLCTGGNRRSARLRGRPQHTYSEVRETFGEDRKAIFLSPPSERKRKARSAEDVGAKAADDDALADPSASSESQRKKKTPEMFMSKAEKARREADLREMRIQQEMLRIKQENDRMLNAKAAIAIAEGSAPGPVTSTFFQKKEPLRRTTEAKTTERDTTTDAVDDMWLALRPGCYGYACDRAVRTGRVELLRTPVDRVPRAQSMLFTDGHGPMAYVAQSACPDKQLYDLSFDLRDLAASIISLWRVPARRATLCDLTIAAVPVEVATSAVARTTVDMLSAGMSSYQEACAHVTKYLGAWAQRRATRAGRRSTSAAGAGTDDDLQDSDEEYAPADGGVVPASLCVLHGASGSGKTLCVHEAARMTGVQVIEVNAAQLRSAQSIKKLVAEVCEAQRMAALPPSSSSSSGGGGGSGGLFIDVETVPRGQGCTSTAILFDEGDLLCTEEEEASLHNAIRGICAQARCAIVLTCEALPAFLLSARLPFAFTYIRTGQAPLAEYTRSLTLPTTSPYQYLHGHALDAHAEAHSFTPTQAVLGALLACCGDARAARQQLLLAYGKDVLPSDALPLAPSLRDAFVSRWAADFVVFDEVLRRFCRRVPCAAPAANPVLAVFAPELHSAHPHSVSIDPHEENVVILHGKYFLQRVPASVPAAAQVDVCGLFAHIAGHALPCRIINDDEVAVSLPVALATGIHALRVALHVPLGGERRFTSDQAAYSQSAATLLSANDVHLYVQPKSATFVALGKRLAGKHRSFAQHKAVAALLRGMEPTPPGCEDPGAEDRRRRGAGYASTHVCQGQLRLQRKRFDEVRKRGPGVVESEDDAHGDTAVSDSDGELEDASAEQGGTEGSACVRHEARRMLASDDEDDTEAKAATEAKGPEVLTAEVAVTADEPEAEVESEDVKGADAEEYAPAPAASEEAADAAEEQEALFDTQLAHDPKYSHACADLAAQLQAAEARRGDATGAAMRFCCLAPNPQRPTQDLEELYEFLELQSAGDCWPGAQTWEARAGRALDDEEEAGALSGATWRERLVHDEFSALLRRWCLDDDVEEAPAESEPAASVACTTEEALRRLPSFVSHRRLHQLRSAHLSQLLATLTGVGSLRLPVASSCDLLPLLAKLATCADSAERVLHAYNSAQKRRKRLEDGAAAAAPFASKFEYVVGRTPLGVSDVRLLLTLNEYAPPGGNGV